MTLDKPLEYNYNCKKGEYILFKKNKNFFKSIATFRTPKRLIV
ncbi:hypothetical protein DJ90_6216 [Paenibacillus macerans]|uniref:Uncharacterized protein n=1 Tax=Paenibacillus macerans TaxID=44252 RepID=A0A090Y9Y9_PAEMA|nr:hypothetical protein DJ90_6216 [Paenibacillus macerans]